MKNSKLILYSIVFLTALLFQLNSQNVKFSIKQPAVDDNYKYTANYKIDMNAVIKNKNSDSNDEMKTSFAGQEEKITILTVLNTEKDKITKAEIFYEKAEDFSKADEEVDKNTHAVAGKSYIIEIKNNRNIIKYKNNQIPVKEEIDYIDVESLLDFKGFHENLIEKKLKPGDKVPLFESKLESLISESDFKVNTKKLEVFFNETKNMSDQFFAYFNINLDIDLFMDETSVINCVLNGDLLVNTENINIYELKIDGDMTMNSEDK